MKDSRISDSQSVAGAYEGSAAAWDEGPSPLYEHLARAIVDAYPLPLAGARVLDLGAGTGAVSRVLIERGAVPYAVDSAHDMIERARAHGVEGTVGDILDLPFPDESYDGAIAAFSLSHVADPVRALTEARRATRAGGAISAAVFAAGPAQPSKDVIQDVAATFGYVAPAWYLELKNVLEPLTNTAPALRACAEQAGLTRVTVTERTADAGIDTPESIVACRLGMAHLAPFVRSLDDARRSKFIAAATAAVTLNPVPLAPAYLIMTGVRG